MKLTNKQFYLVAALLLALILVAMAGEGPDETKSTTSPAITPRAIVEDTVRLPGSASELQRPLLDLAGLSDDGLPATVRDDGFTGGQSITISTGKGTVAFYTMPDDGLWKVRITSGWGERCGKTLSDEAVIKRFITTVTPSIDSSGIAPKLVQTLRAGEVGQVRIGSLRYGASGGCVQIVDVTELNALPPEKRPD